MNLKQFFRRITQGPLERLCYRDVIEREVRTDGEHIKLSCGHRVHLIPHRRASFPCDQCREDSALRERDKEPTE